MSENAAHDENPSDELWELRLYIAGRTPRSEKALGNLRRICDEHLAGVYPIEVVDLMKKPQLARGDQIVAVPALGRKLPEPVRKIIGDLSNTEKVLVGLDLRPRSNARKEGRFGRRHSGRRTGRSSFPWPGRP